MKRRPEYIKTPANACVRIRPDILGFMCKNSITMSGSLRSPPSYPAPPDFHPMQGAEHASLRFPLVSSSKLLNTHSAPSSSGGGKGTGVTPANWIRRGTLET